MHQLTYTFRAPAPAMARRRAAGFSMIEVMVSILIISFGLLGIAGLQANTAKYKINSWARAAASTQFSDIADRLRANPTQTGLSFSSNNAAASTSSYVLTDNWSTQQAADLTIATDCLGTNCTTAQRATYDMLMWRTKLRSTLPQGAGYITGNRATGVTATIAWYDKQFVTVGTSTLDRSQLCTAGLSAAAQTSCCPSGLVGNPATAGVRCTNITFVP
jgi:type IV pilus assembly protein PilV